MISATPHRHGYDSGCSRALLRHPRQDPNGEHRGGDRSGGQESGHAPVHVTLLGVDRGASRFRYGGVKQVGSHRGWTPKSSISNGVIREPPPVPVRPTMAPTTNPESGRSQSMV